MRILSKLINNLLWSRYTPSASHTPSVTAGTRNYAAQLHASGDSEFSFFVDGLPKCLKILSNEKPNAVFYYPACGQHFQPPSLNHVFKKAIYLDPDPKVRDRITSHIRDQNLSESVIFYNGNAQDYEGLDENKPFADIVLLRNFYGFSIEDIYDQIRPGGLIIVSNSWNPQAYEMSQSQSVNFKEVIYFDPDNNEETEPKRIEAGKVKWYQDGPQIVAKFREESESEEININTGFFIFEKPSL